MRNVYIFILVVILLVMVQPAFAAPTTPPAPLLPQGLFEKLGAPDSECLLLGNCTMEDLVQLVVNIINFLLGIAGVTAMFFFAYGGYNFITSYGSDEKVEAGMKSIGGAVVGIVVVMVAYVGVKFVLQDLLCLQLRNDSLRIAIDADKKPAKDTCYDK